MQYNKVEISGVNTNELKTLKESEKLELLKKAHSGDKKAREELINGNLRLVLSVLQKFVSRSDSPDDLFQVGVIMADMQNASRSLLDIFLFMKFIVGLSISNIQNTMNIPASIIVICGRILLSLFIFILLYR